MQWLTSKSQDIAIAKAGGVAARNSTLDDASVLALYPEYNLLKEQLKYTNPDWRPIIPEWAQIDEQILGIRVSEALIGKSTPQQALNDCLPAIDEVMQRGGYWKN
jgi:multiple sugar transport system substrate-binding protein